MAFELNARELVLKLSHAAADKAPAGISNVLNFLIDELIFPKFLDGLIFPKKETDFFKQYEDRINKMIEKQIEASIGQSAFEQVKARLGGLGHAFKEYANVVDLEERKIRLGYLISLAELTVAEVESVPDKYLHLLTDALMLVAITHIAVLLERVKMYPERYEHQMALNGTAIRYSDLAGRIRDRFLWHRLGQIAGGKGILLEEDVEKRQLPSKPAEKRVKFTSWDDMAQWWMATDYSSQFLIDVKTDWVLANAVDPKYVQKKEEAQGLIAKYGEAEKKKVYDWWDEHLTKTTAEFMQFVDWDGVNGKRKPKDRMTIRAYPLKRVDAVNDKLTVPERIDLFLGQQMDQFVANGPRYVQTYRLPGPARYGEQGNMFYRADTYDTAVAAIYLAMRGQLQRACDLADGLCTALEHDSIGGGRIVAATKADSVIDPNDGYATSIFYPDGGTHDIGNMCWAGIALTRLYAKTRQTRYLHNARLIGNWIKTECLVMDDAFGFSGGVDAWGAKRLWRSVEHNVDAYAFFKNLGALTSDAQWNEAANHAQKLVLACRLAAGYYVTGTGNDKTLNAGIVPTDAQSWTALAKLNESGNEQSLQYMLDKLSAQTAGYSGFKFALAGSNIQNEATAGAVMALYLQGGQLKDKANAYYQSLEAQIKRATNSDGLGVVATPGSEADTGAGLGWKYFNWLHVASSAWTGLAFLARDDAYANPYALVKI